MEHAAELARCLIECDVAQIRRLWRHVSPHLPQPKTDKDALISIHIARTQMESLAFRLRAYSHRWLWDNGCGYLSAMPDHLKPSAERLYPCIVDGVGVACKSSFREVGQFIQREMSNAVMECYADNKRDPLYVKPVMMERRWRAKKILHGILSEAAERELRGRTLKSLKKTNG